MKQNNLQFMGLNPESLSQWKDIQKKVDSGVQVEPQTLEALKAINLASKVVNTIMSGNQIDPVFFKKLSEITESKIKSASQKTEKKVLKKKRKFKKK